MDNKEKTMDKIVALCKNRGFVFPGSEIYGGLANTWDYGPLGVELKNNVKRAWWKKFIQENPYNVGQDAAILMNPQTWVASGHLGGFSDPLMDCRECKERFRADKLIEDWCAETGHVLEKPIDAFTQAEMKSFIEDNNIPCPTCGKHNFTDIRQFNLMFKTFQGVTEDAKNTVYLRPETAQGIFVNFVNVQRTTRRKIPFGIGQIGKSFRNEITPGNFIFRVREFEQMELEFFCEPGTDLEWFASAGASFGALPTAQITTLLSTRTHPARTSAISIRKRTQDIFLMLSNRRSVSSAPSLHSLLMHMMKKSSPATKRQARKISA